MNKSTVEPACTGQFSSLFLDYLDQKPELATFYNQFPKIENFKTLIAERNFSENTRNILVEALQKQYEGIPISENTQGQIEALKEGNTFTVTTGHQLNLFTGPLYFIYKIVSAINLSRKLAEAYPEYHFIPVYWMATEDHDFEEINYFKLDGKKYQWHSDQKGAVGDYELDDSFINLWKEVKVFAPACFQAAYTNSKTLGEAVRKYVHELFGEEGLLIVDGQDTSLKKLFREVIEKDIFEQLPHHVVTKTTNALKDLKYDSQIFPREINQFYLVKGLRERIEKVGSIYKVLNSDFQFTESEMRELIKAHPERFSPNVVLRPVYQEMILPNLAYLGGPAEVVYWLQLKDMFDVLKVPFPAIMPRNFALVLNRRILHTIDKLQLSNQELFESVADWKKRYVDKNANLDIELSGAKASLATIFETNGSEVAVLEKSLENAFEAAKVRSLKILDKLSKKVRRAEEKRHGIVIGQREAVRDYLYPGGSPQERVENFLKFHLEDEDFIKELLALFDPFDFDFMILRNE